LRFAAEKTSLSSCSGGATDDNWQSKRSTDIEHRQNAELVIGLDEHPVDTRELIKEEHTVLGVLEAALVEKLPHISARRWASECVITT
jgi:hypothetical protein